MYIVFSLYIIYLTNFYYFWFNIWFLLFSAPASTDLRAKLLKDRMDRYNPPPPDPLPRGEYAEGYNTQQQQQYLQHIPPTTGSKRSRRSHHDGYSANIDPDKRERRDRIIHAGR